MGCYKVIATSTVTTTLFLFAKIYMHRSGVVIIHTSISSFGFLTYEKCLLTDLNMVNTLYAYSHVTVIFARK